MVGWLAGWLRVGVNSVQDTRYSQRSDRINYEIKYAGYANLADIDYGISGGEKAIALGPCSMAMCVLISATLSPSIMAFLEQARERYEGIPKNQFSH